MLRIIIKLVNTTYFLFNSLVSLNDGINAKFLIILYLLNAYMNIFYQNMFTDFLLTAEHVHR